MLNAGAQEIYGRGGRFGGDSGLDGGAGQGRHHLTSPSVWNPPHFPGSESFRNISFWGLPQNGRPQKWFPVFKSKQGHPTTTGWDWVGLSENWPQRGCLRFVCEWGGSTRPWIHSIPGWTVYTLPLHMSGHMQTPFVSTPYFDVSGLGWTS